MVNESDASGPALRAEGLLKRYGGTTVVDGIDLHVPRGECFGLLGPNGAGKTTTLRMILGVTPPDGGTLEVLGEPVPARARAMRARMGVVPQIDNLDPDFTVRENLFTYASYHGLGREAARPRVDELLAFAALEGKADAPIASLSGGMKRRLTLARALVNDPDLVVLDEPSTGLDPQARQNIWQKLRALQKQGRTLVITTHYMEEAERLCDRLAIMDHGRIIDCDSPAALARSHLERYVVELRGDEARAWLGRAGLSGAARVREVGETVLLYADDPAPVAGALHEQGLTYLQRPTNLEDVFLHLTGHELRE
ncbi:MAG: ATP-binding cassette domain-containing protein [Halorhodospira halophila]|uniref:ATP-binding cassette domain-containing protein n=1 Tax=Halorhodospira TaxID=85108 RepID=UPI001EE8B063|nr:MULTISPECIES: ATP-binding cassette domain-containing protein [Halorhodospira]MCC3751813.1 ATP-binding cassette domain-containing protein [Halorhodospira halophila]MCG5528996.1 ATP-binding cassette domain-containing protein [Halorhodospira halophila]MCG5533050.1 ATP-binding cassette domain-containing protein [Halorhodospira sp. 9621]MCG5540327.1 ATP-binding cassette domain-containing protein [Halorhodospira sp. M39old]MCG5544094.1 ATP-binding cassette domain-containing protein [Halorhodospir